MKFDAIRYWQALFNLVRLEQTQKQTKERLNMYTAEEILEEPYNEVMKSRKYVTNFLMQHDVELSEFTTCNKEFFCLRKVLEFLNY